MDPGPGNEPQNWYQEFSRLKGQCASLERTQRHLLGEDLGLLSLRQVQKLERQLESALSQTRKRKTQLLMDQMEDLKKKLEAADSSERNTKGFCEVPDAPGGSAPFSANPSQPYAVDAEPILEIGFHHLASDEAAGPRSTLPESNFMQNWALWRA
ncbi:uncharacterized protein A4U43_C08F1910 [Asparagus officinalis]|nr:uncharacterized protein A4U43_C08F1910 [Asparagus officinalis]